MSTTSGTNGQAAKPTRRSFSPSWRTLGWIPSTPPSSKPDDQHLTMLVPAWRHWPGDTAVFQCSGMGRLTTRSAKPRYSQRVMHTSTRYLAAHGPIQHGEIESRPTARYNPSSQG